MPHAGRKGFRYPALLRCLLMALACVWPLAAPAADETRAIGEAAPPFTLPKADGSSYSLAEALKSRPVLVAFLSTPCKPCEDSIADLLDLCERHGEAGTLEVAGIALKGTDALKGLIGDGRPGCRLTLVEEVTSEERFLTADAYGVIATPTFFLVGKDGKILWKHIGRIKTQKADPELRKALGL